MKIYYIKLLAILEDSYKRHGVIIIILFAVVAYFYFQVDKLETFLNESNERLISNYETNQKELVKALERSNIALERSNDVIERNTDVISLKLK